MELAEKKVPKLKVVQPIKLRNYQKEHYQKIISILQNEIGYLDYSPTGSGKTHVTLAIAATFKMGVIIICPKTVSTNWRKCAKRYGIHVYCVMTYQTLRGNKTGVNHDLLRRDGNVFYATDVLEKCARHGVLIVFDECHALKNENSQLYSAHALVKEAKRLSRMGYNIRISALSATPGDKKENIASLLKILGVIISDKLYKYNRTNKIYEMVGLREVVDKANRYDRNSCFHACARPLNKTTVKFICHDIYTRILKRNLTSGMPEPPNLEKKDAKNLFAIMPKEDVEQIRNAAMLFKSATNYRHEIGEVNYQGINWGDLIKSRREIDSGKVRTMVRLAKNDLDSDPNCQVILYLNYTRDIHRAYDLLLEYNPMILNGEVTKQSDRDDIIEKFQSDDKYRLLISHPKVGGMSIDLHDLHGNRPRITYLLPSYSFIDLYQATGRTHREGGKSVSKIRFIYSKDFPHESGILDSMARKSKNIRDIMNSKQESIVLPGEYDDEIEEDKIDEINA